MKHNGHISLNFTRLSLEEQLKRSRQFLDDMRKRRTVREFSTEPVLPELIENAIATAGMAPSGANQQPWTFVAVSDPALKKQIRQAAEVAIGRAGQMECTYQGRR